MLIFVKFIPVISIASRLDIFRRSLGKENKFFFFSRLLENGVRGGAYEGAKLKYQGASNGYYEREDGYSLTASSSHNSPKSHFNKGNGYSLRCVVRQEGGGENKE